MATEGKTPKDYDKPQHHAEAIAKMPHAKDDGHNGPSGYEKPEHHSDMIQDGGPSAHVGPAGRAPLRHPAPSHAHGFGHGASQRHGALRMSGHPRGHQIGKRKGK
jgi:hypothetical protein